MTQAYRDNGASRAYVPAVPDGYPGIGRTGETRAINRSGTRLAQLRDFEIANC